MLNNTEEIEPEDNFEENPEILLDDYEEFIVKEPDEFIKPKLENY